MLLIISDVHANVVALLSVMSAVNIEEVDMIVHAGDVVGYNPFPNEVIREFLHRRVRSISGNHDRAVVSENYRNFNLNAALAAIWTRKKISAEALSYLSSLPNRMEVEYDGSRILIVHGAPFDDDYYLYPEEATPSLLKDYDVVICGHTHVPFVKAFDKGIIMNPGSVGQPRDGDARACCALFDGKKVNILRVKYDIDTVANKIIEEKLPIELAHRLYFGI